MSIEEHICKVWSSFNSIDKDMYGIKYPSIPITHFGNYNEYKKSSLKIVTVGLNPSKEEFPSDDAFSRFYGAERIFHKQQLSNEDVQIYLNALNIYFEYNWNVWFEHFEPILNSMNASYHKGIENTVIHTDLCPFTTALAWSKYEKSTNSYIVEDLMKKGSEAWRNLISILKPQVILTSLGDSYKSRMLIEQNPKWTLFEAFDKTSDGRDRRKPFEIHCTVGRPHYNHKCLLVFGMNGLIPFMISGDQKSALGRKIYDLFNRKVSVKQDLPDSVEEESIEEEPAEEEEFSPFVYLKI